MAENKRTPLYDEHVRLNAKIIDFHGWDMPLQYTRILDEHMAVRKHVGIFDVSHMGDIMVEGEDAAKFLDHMFPTKISNINDGEAIYTAFLNQDSNIIDDTIVYRLSHDRFFFVPNASMIDTIHSWVLKNSNGYSVNIVNYSDQIACIALQGPESSEVMRSLSIPDPGSFKFVEIENDMISHNNEITGNKTAIISGTGYTGEHGVEIICSAQDAVSVWNNLIVEISKHSGLPCGLGSRDTLRMEKGMLLSGTDFHGDRNPHECSISFIVNNDGEFIGKESLKNKREQIFRGFVIDSKNIPRSGNEITIGGKVVGNVTSGTLSPILEKSIALGFIKKEYSKSGTVVKILLRGKELEATVSRPKMIP